MLLSNMPLSPKWRLPLSVGLPALIGLGCTYCAVRLFTSYGWVLFLGLPILVSFVSALIYRRTGHASWGSSYRVGLLSILLLGGVILIFAIDGILCLLMALPLAMVLALVGSSLGYLLGKRLSVGVSAAVPILLVVAFPLLVAFESHQSAQPELHAVTTRIAIAASIHKVWDEVIAFDRITAPPGGIFRLGIAYPIEARIDGEGLGAIRYCVFSTGPFVEPITVWDAPHVLGFRVTSNPPPMKEFSPWKQIETPHLHDTFVSERGQFRLSEEDGKTVLEGTTWYRQKISPDWYWHRISDEIIHLIHLRVLEHIKAEAEKNG
jgi:hypothetical protein